MVNMFSLGFENTYSRVYKVKGKTHNRRVIVTFFLFNTTKYGVILSRRLTFHHNIAGQDAGHQFANVVKN